MRSQPIMTAAAVWPIFVAALCLFVPAQILADCGVRDVEVAVVLVQALGAASLGFGVLNWVARRSPVGGIYGRPVASGNLTHFGCGALVLGRAFVAHRAWQIVVGLAIYSALTMAFAWLLLAKRSPSEAPPN